MINFSFDITKVNDYKNVCLTTHNGKNFQFSPKLVKCGDQYISLTDKTYLIMLLMKGVLGIKTITESNYVDVYQGIQNMIMANGSYGVEIKLCDVKNHIGLEVF